MKLHLLCTYAFAAMLALLFGVLVGSGAEDASAHAAASPAPVPSAAVAAPQTQLLLLDTAPTQERSTIVLAGGTHTYGFKFIRRF